jgi:hypothetical protein
MRKYLYLFVLGSFAALAEEEVLIQTMDIAPVNPETYGVQQGVENPIPLDIWKGLTHAQVMALLKKLPHQQHYPTLKRLQKQLLLAPSHMPEKGAEDQGNILALRIKHLQDSGDIESAYLLAKTYPEVLTKPDWHMLRFFYALKRDDHVEAMQIAKEALGQNPEDLQWAKAIITLQLLKGEKEAALLGLSLLEEKKDQSLASFFTLVRHKTEGKSLPSDFAAQDPIEAKLLETKPTLKEKLLTLEAEHSEGRFDKEKLQQLYLEHADVTPKPEVLEGSMNDGLIALPEVPFDWEKDDPLTRAKLYGLLAAENDTSQKVKLLHQAVHHMNKHQKEFFASIFLDDLKSLPIQETFKDYAKDFAKVLLVYGEQSLAVQWLALVSLDDKVHLAPWIIFGVDDISLSAKQSLFARWYAQETAVKNIVALSLFEALVPGVTENRSIALESKEEGMIDILPLYFALKSNRGAALVYALCLGQGDNSSVLPFVVEGLKTLGFEKEAKQLALSFFK